MRNGASAGHGAVVWVTGLPNSGKTTVAQELCGQLREAGLAPIHLDGDVLRSLFGDRWGYSEAERHDLAATYARLAGHLASQGATVVVSVVAMFPFVYRRNREVIRNYVEVLLRAPYAERIVRDEKTRKGVLLRSDYSDAIYSDPPSPDLVIENHGSLSAEAAARLVAAHVIETVAQVA